MKKRNENSLTEAQRQELFGILFELQGAFESVSNGGGTITDLEHWQKPLFERTSAILGRNLIRYYETIAALKRHGIVDEFREAEASKRDLRMRYAERFGLPYDSRDSAFLNRHEAEADWLDQYGSN